MGFVWVHVGSFLHRVASPFHSFVTTTARHRQERQKQRHNVLVVLFGGITTWIWCDCDCLSVCGAVCLPWQFSTGFDGLCLQVLGGWPPDDRVHAGASLFMQNVCVGLLDAAKAFSCVYDYCVYLTRFIVLEFGLVSTGLHCFLWMTSAGLGSLFWFLGVAGLIILPSPCNPYMYCARTCHHAYGLLQMSL